MTRKRMIASDPDAPEATDEQLAQAKPFDQAFPALADAMRKNIGVRPKSENPKVSELSPLIYIASPYSGSSDEIAYRVHETGRFYAWLIRQGGCDPFSPILHDHTPATTHGLPTDAAFWRDRNLRWLLRCEGLYLLKIDGWSESLGVTMELEWARSNAIPVTVATPDGDSGYSLDNCSHARQT